MNWFLQALRNTLQTSGRACRREFWFFILGINVITLFTSILDQSFGLLIEDFFLPVGYITVTLSFLFLLPFITVTIRRLHDSGLSGYWILAMFLPFGTILTIILTIRPSDPQANKYGPPVTGRTFNPEVERPESDESGRFDA